MTKLEYEAHLRSSVKLMEDAKEFLYFAAPAASNTTDGEEIKNAARDLIASVRKIGALINKARAERESEGRGGLRHGR